MFTPSINHSYIVRLWLEPRDHPTDTPTWRGMVEYVPTGEKSYFIHFEQLITFILEKIAPPSIQNQEKEEE
jgi:hypothetical protein